MVDHEYNNELTDIKEKIADIDRRLKSIERSRAMSRIFKLLYLLVIIGLGIAFYIYLAPFYQSVSDIYNFGSEQKENLENNNSLDIDQALNLLESLQQR